ncbi:tyrosine-type recombinase/integrase [Salipiger sp. H15]|uniref:Tyrosine-type recombinase/integrase n=1 Tax=Alloyangia sp. H15 TaxID=3029062 RepID=A0AAU8AFK7_9RHOB
MKPPKPRIQRKGLIWRWERGAWQPYHRSYWTEDGKPRQKEVFLAWGGDEVELDRMYWLARSGKHATQVRPATHTWRECIVEWRSDLTIQGELAPSTKKSYRRAMDTILEKNGGKDMRDLTRKQMRAALSNLAATPRKASRYAQTISILWNYAAKELDWPLGPNPASGLAKYKPAREYEPWPDWMIAKLNTAPERVQIAAELIRGTGQRPSAAITMRRDQFAGEWMTVVDEKSDEMFPVYCPDRLRVFVDGLPKRGAHMLAKNLTEPVGYSSIEHAFRTWRKDLGERAKPFTLHGLRKLAIVELAEAGASDAEIQAVTGQSAQMVAFYRKKANRKALSKAAQKRRE